MSKKTPVAIFAYNRPDHTLRSLTALSKCRRFSECEFYLYSDGAKTDAASGEVETTRVVLQDWAAAHDAQVIEQPQNLGLAKSVVTGVTDLCARYGRVIVVEDDLIVSPDFLHFMIESLDHYETDEQVMQVGGFTLSPPANLATDAFLLPVTTTWGWGTWQRAWKQFAWVPAELEATKRDEAWQNLFNLNGACAFSSMLEDRLAGKNDSWGILWWYAVSRSRGLVAYPTRSLVWNGGFDGSGIHCGSGDFLNQGDVPSYSMKVLPTALHFPDAIKFEMEQLTQLEAFFRSKLTSSTLAAPEHGLWKVVQHRLKNIARRAINAIN